MTLGETLNGGIAMNSLYRFLSFESFVDIVQTNCLTFVKPEMWEDPYESYILKTLKRPGGIEEIKKCIGEIGIDRLPDLSFLSEIGTNYYGQCWTQTPESDAFWRIYSFNNKSIRIEINRDDIDKLECDGIKVIHGPIVYEKDINLKTELNKVLKNNQTKAA